MPCPPDKPIHGSGTVSSYGEGTTEATAHALAAVPGAATSAAMTECHCPDDCRFASPYNVKYLIGSVSTSWSLWNIPSLGTFALLGEDWLYEATVEFDWWATARCVGRMDEQYLSLAIEHVRGTEPPASHD